MTEPISVRIHRSTRTGKKLVAIFTLKDGRTRTVHFGAAGASDFTQHRDPARKQRPLARHAPREDWTKPMTAAGAMDTVAQGDLARERRGLLTSIRPDTGVRRGKRL